MMDGKIEVGYNHEYFMFINGLQNLPSRVSSGLSINTKSSVAVK